MLGDVSSATTINIYSHITNTMQRQAAAKKDRQIVSRQELSPADAEIPRAGGQIYKYRKIAGNKKFIIGLLKNGQRVYNIMATPHNYYPSGFAA